MSGQKLKLAHSLVKVLHQTEKSVEQAPPSSTHSKHHDENDVLLQSVMRWNRRRELRCRAEGLVKKHRRNGTSKKRRQHESRTTSASVIP